MKTICIMCPVGCALEIKKTKDEITVKGNACPRGIIYGKKEFSSPERVVTTIIKTKTGIASVKSTASVPKEKVADVVAEIKKLPPKNYTFGDIIIKNVCGLNADIIVTSF